MGSIGCTTNAKCSSNMDILQVNKKYPPVVGGVETVVSQIAEGCAERGHSVTVLTCREPGNHGYLHESRNSVEVIRAGSWGEVVRLSLAPNFLGLYHKAIQRADLVHFHIPSPLPELCFFWKRLPKEKSVIATFHADPLNTKFSAFAPAYRFVLRPLLSRADRIVVTAPRNAENNTLESYREKIEIIPLAPDLPLGSVSQFDERKVRDEWGVEEAPLVLTVGRLAYYKGLKYLIQAAEKVHAHFLIVGDGELRRDLQRQAKSLGVEDRVHFAGFVPDNELPKYYAAADIFALPSVEAAEAFGIVQVEAMAYGLPVINTDLPTGVPFVSRHGQTGLTVPPRDEQALADSIQRLIENPSLRKRLSKNARLRSKKFSLEKMIDKHTKIYKKLSK